MAVVWVVVISRAIEICWHGAVVVKPIFFAVVLAEFQADDFC